MCLFVCLFSAGQSIELTVDNSLFVDIMREGMGG